MSKWSVWIGLEEYDEERDDFNEGDLPFAATATFDTQEEATAFATRLHEMGLQGV